MTPVKPQKSNKGFNFYFQMPELIMKIFSYLHTPLPASVSCLLNMPDLQFENVHLLHMKQMLTTGLCTIGLNVILSIFYAARTKYFVALHAAVIRI
jgi:hypothetical protein